MFSPAPGIIDWLMEGDPVIRWQTLRDLLHAPEADWESERAKVVAEGWGRELLARQDENGSWSRGRWTEDIWTLLNLVDFGLGSSASMVVPPLKRGLFRLFPDNQPVTAEHLFRVTDMCHLAFWLRVAANFISNDPRLPLMAASLLSFQMPDGGWNCRIRTNKNAVHSSFHTTFNVLDALRLAGSKGIISPLAVETSEARALEFMLNHRLFKSDKTGEIVSERFLDLSYPSYWHYNVLRGLDYLRTTRFTNDPRLADALDYLKGRQDKRGRWPVEKRISGKTHFDMEAMGKANRWNTLRALRVLNSVEFSIR